MKYITHDHGEIFLEKYLKYLSDIQNKMPQGAKEFSLLPYHYDMTDGRCPHDSWLEFFFIKELSSGPRNQIRNVNIDCSFLGSRHDGRFILSYIEVSYYDIRWPGHEKLSAGHGDWLIDEVLLTPNGTVSHEVHFSSHSVWMLEAKDIRFCWIPKA